jgi:hypothetical protein
MARIKIKDLPKDRKITKEEMKKVFGGYIDIPGSSLADPRPTPIFSYQPLKPGFGQMGTITYTSGVITDT